MSKQNPDEQPWMLQRRAFLKLGAGFGLSALMGWANPLKLPLLTPVRASGGAVTPRGSARNVVLVMLRGGISHIDTFDLKLGRWTPAKFAPDNNAAGYLWPNGIMPGLSQRADKFSVVRTLQHQEEVHERAEYYVETGRRLNPGLQAEIPHVGTIIALESEARRSAQDILPAFVLLNQYSYTLSNNGFLPVNYAAFQLTQPDKGIPNLVPTGGLSFFERRRASLDQLNQITSAEIGDMRQPATILQGQAEKLMRDPITSAIFTITDEDRARYGSNHLGHSLTVARNMLKADRGTRFIEVDQFGWDHHNNIYGDNPSSLIGLTALLDKSLSAFIDDLAAAPGAKAPSLLDETLVIVTGEFGRTVGDLNRQLGRDHYPYAFSALFMGGGVKGGRIIGATDPTGAGIVDFGWKEQRPIYFPDMAATIYSALGIDWTKTISDTPSGRIFRYTEIDSVDDVESTEIAPLF